MATQNSDPTGLFAIPYDDVVRVGDSANESLGDAIYMNPRAAAAVKRLFEHFGVEGTPRTWGQLAGAVAYCELLFCFHSGPMDEVSMECAVELMEHQHPDLVEPLKAYQNGDLARLLALHRERISFEYMSAHFDTVNECWNEPHLRRAG